MSARKFKPCSTYKDSGVEWMGEATRAGQASVGLPAARAIGYGRGILETLQSPQWR